MIQNFLMNIFLNEVHFRCMTISGTDNISQIYKKQYRQNYLSFVLIKFFKEINSSPACRFSKHFAIFPRFSFRRKGLKRLPFPGLINIVRSQELLRLNRRHT
jgi:hypothetical protein